MDPVEECKALILGIMCITMHTYIASCGHVNRQNCKGLYPIDDLVDVSQVKDVFTWLLNIVHYLIGNTLSFIGF